MSTETVPVVTGALEVIKKGLVGTNRKDPGLYQHQ